MSLPRRGFLKLAGALAAVVGKPAVGVAGNSPAALAGLAGAFTSSIPDIVVTPTHNGLGDPDHYTVAYQAAAQWMAANGLPDYVMDHVRLRAARVDALDPDLAANRSFSLSAKFAMQRQRNTDRLLVSAQRTANNRLKSHLFESAMGFRYYF